jgi:glyoxalase superfamily protein
LTVFPVMEQKGGAVDVRPDSRAPAVRWDPAAGAAPEWSNAVSSVVFNITFDCADPCALARFWGQVTGWPVTEQARPGYEEAAVGSADQGCPRLYFVRVSEGKTVKNRVHLDIMPADRTQDEEITRLTGLGARILMDRRPEFGWVLLADPEGNEFDVEISVAELDAARAAQTPA